MKAPTSIGSVMGELTEKSGGRFCIKPPIGPTSIVCNFSETLRKAAKAKVGKTVRAYGRKYYRRKTGLPFRIDVDRIKELKRRRISTHLKPPTKPYTGEPADLQVRRIREEWD